MGVFWTLSLLDLDPNANTSLNPLNIGVAPSDPRCAQKRCIWVTHFRL